MAKLKKEVISYYSNKNKWHSSSRSNKRETPNITLYWGANRVPIPLTIEKKITRSTTFSRIIKTAHVKQGDQRVVMGPLIGILTSQNSKGALNGLQNNFKDLINTGKKYGALVFVFTPHDVNWNNKTIHGRIYDFGLKRYKRYHFPFPNVIYNRIPTRYHENKILYQNCIAKFLKISKLTLFNPCFFNKEDVYNQLASSSNIKRYLPDTHKYQSKKEFLNMLELYHTIYLKPTTGKKGKGIMKVESDKESKRYKLYYYEGKEVKMFQTSSMERLWNKVCKKVNSSYIMQQAAILAKIDKCPFDFRVLVQKNRIGVWQVSGVGIRVAGNPKSFTTHVPRGGKIDTPKNILPKIFPEKKAEEILSKVKQLAVAIASKLENHYVYLGEVSMDIGVDKNGELWFFETNAKPMKFDEPNIRHKQLKNIIDYAKYLTFDHRKEN